MSDKKGLPKVKIDCFTISLQSHKDRSGETKNVGFDSFPNRPSSKEDINASCDDFIVFFKAFASSFGKKFAVYKSTNKALFVDSTKLTFNSRERIISGIVEGGTTNFGGQYKRQNNTSDEDAIPIDPKHVDAQPYYFLMWFPNDRPFGYLIVQSFSSKTITETFCKHMFRFVSKTYFKISLLINRTVPEEYAKDVKEKSAVSKITLKKPNVNPQIVAKMLGLDYVMNKDVTFEFSIKGIKNLTVLKDMVEEVEKNPETRILDTEELRNLGFQGVYETSVEYDNEGKKNTSKSTQSYDFKPRIYLNEHEFERDIYNLPTYESLDSYCKEFLETLKKDGRLAEGFEIESILTF